MHWCNLSAVYSPCLHHAPITSTQRARPSAGGCQQNFNFTGMQPTSVIWSTIPSIASSEWNLLQALAESSNTFCPYAKVDLLMCMKHFMAFKLSLPSSFPESPQIPKYGPNLWRKGLHHPEKQRKNLSLIWSQFTHAWGWPAAEAHNKWSLTALMMKGIQLKGREAIHNT